MTTTTAQHQRILAVGAALEVWRRAHEQPNDARLNELADEATAALDAGDWVGAIAAGLAARCGLRVEPGSCGRTVGHAGPCRPRLCA